MNNEKYNCLLPVSLTEELRSTKEDYDGPSPFQLLKPLFSQLTCSYRQEQFWTYELCHGKWLRQYHEESTLQASHTQEYILGMYDITKYEIDDLEHRKNLKANPNQPTMEVYGHKILYAEISMVGGTQCDVNSNLRYSQVLYGCGEKLHEIYSVKETITCEYEVIVLSSLLCKHPKYRMQKMRENPIHCHSINGSPRKPVSLFALENVKEDSLEEEPEKPPNVENPVPKAAPISTPHDPKIIWDFLSGDYCLQGGTTWWKYEFCYGKSVQQYHEEKGKSRSTILLGTWNHQVHVDWLAQNAMKKPKPGVIPRVVSHFYSDGTLCDLTGKPRQVEVKLKCKEVKGHPDMMSSYLTEPRTCEYILKVESPIICPLLETVDENGLFHPES